jgi:hypothetical protein
MVLIFTHALLLKDNLLWMFVPRDKDGKIMEEPQSIKKKTHLFKKSDNGDSLTKKRFYIVTHQAK